MTRSGKKRPKKRDGLPVLDDHADINQFFSDKDAQDQCAPSFAEVVEETFTGRGVEEFLNEKEAIPADLEDGTVAGLVKRYPPPEGELDLHGHTAPEAEIRTENFLQTARGSGLRTVRIITGRGLHSEGNAVLPDVVEHRLQELIGRKLVLAYRWEKEEKHKSGAVLVYLRRQQEHFF